MSECVAFLASYSTLIAYLLLLERSNATHRPHALQYADTNCLLAYVLAYVVACFRDYVLAYVIMSLLAYVIMSLLAYVACLAAWLL